MNARRSGDSILFTFADDGPGIPPEYHEVIFRKFGQVASGVITPRVRSSGLGLTFCKLVVDLHGGMIWVRSREGEGSAFHVQLPLSAMNSGDQFETRVRIRGTSLGS
jgi:signal transduction histidine kinase